LREEEEEGKNDRPMYRERESREANEEESSFLVLLDQLADRFVHRPVRFLTLGTTVHGHLASRTYRKNMLVSNEGRDEGWTERKNTDNATTCTAGTVCDSLHTLSSLPSCVQTVELEDGKLFFDQRNPSS
jgi:hypothetical protein